MFKKHNVYKVSGALVAVSMAAFLALPALAQEVRKPDMEKPEKVEAMSNKGVSMSETHRSAVSKAVEGLLEIAGKNVRIGDEVKKIATEEKESSERAAEAMKAVESRGRFQTILFGTDYKNLGKLRSELVTTQNHIDRLMKAKERATDAVKAALDAHIAELQKTKAAAETFIKGHESAFSFLGWFVRLFNR